MSTSPVSISVPSIPSTPKLTLVPSDILADEANPVSIGEAALTAAEAIDIDEAAVPTIVEPLALGSFPHAPRSAAAGLRTTIQNVQHLLSSYKLRPRYDVIRKRTDVYNADGKAVSMDEVISLGALHGMHTDLVGRFVGTLAERDVANPVEEWILSKAWDCKDRLDAFCDTIETTDDYPAPLKRTIIEKWMISAVAAALIKRSRFRARGVLTLQGPQGVGKTSWIASLIPDKKLCYNVIKLDHHLDGGNKDSIIGAVGHWITEIGELDSSFRKDVARLKGFLTNDCDKVRKPYGKEAVELDRRTVFAATVNDEAFLVDNTGNSRWWTIAVQRLDFNHSIDMQQLFAQLAVAFANGAEWWLAADEEAELSEYNKRHKSVSAIAEMLHEIIDHDRIGGGEGKYISPIKLLEQIGISKASNAQCKECASVLKDLIGPRTKVNGNYVWRVPLLSDRPSPKVIPRSDPSRF